MADGLDFSPLSEAEREAGTQEQARKGEPDAGKPTCPPANAEPPEIAAAHLFGHPPQHHLAVRHSGRRNRVLCLPLQQEGRHQRFSATVLVSRGRLAIEALARALVHSTTWMRSPRFLMRQSSFAKARNRRTLRRASLPEAMATT